MVVIMKLGVDERAVSFTSYYDVVDDVRQMPLALGWNPEACSNLDYL